MPRRLSRSLDPELIMVYVMFEGYFFAFRGCFFLLLKRRKKELICQMGKERNDGNLSREHERKNQTLAVIVLSATQYYHFLAEPQRNKNQLTNGPDEEGGLTDRNRIKYPTKSIGNLRLMMTQHPENRTEIIR